MVERAKVEYRDKTPFDQSKLQDLQTLKDAILHKITGKDVRAPIAQIPDAIIKLIEDASNMDDLGALAELVEARGGFETLGLHEQAQDSKIDSLPTKAQFDTKANTTYVDAMLANIAKGGPKELFYSFDALKAKYPTGANGTFLVFDSSNTDGAHSYMWDSSAGAWKDLGAYQASLSMPKTRPGILVTKGVVNINTAKKTLEFDGQYLAVSDAYGQYQMDAYNNNSFVVDIDGFLFYDTVNEKLKMVSAVKEALDSDIQLGYLYFDKGVFYINSKFTVDGASDIGKRQVVNNMITDINKPCLITTAGDIVIDTVNRKLVFPDMSTIALTYGLTTVNLADTYRNKSVDISFGGASAGWLYADPFQKKILTDKDTITEDCYLLGAIWWDKLKFDLNFTFKINGSDYHNMFQGRYGRGKTIAALGDSLTKGIKKGDTLTTPYTDYLPQYTGCTVKNYGVASCRVQLTDDRDDSFVDRIASVDNADYLILFGGMNDYRGSLPIGEVADTDTELDAFDTHTFTGAMEYCINYWLTNHPESNIFLCTIPLQKKDENHSFKPNKLGLYQKDYNDKIKELSNRYSLPLVDMWQLGISPFNKAQGEKWMGDMMHYRAGGYEKIAQYIAGVMKQHIY